MQSLSFRNLPNDELDVPPNSIARHDGYSVSRKPARIDAFQPHMHMRGKAATTLEAINLDNDHRDQLRRSLRLRLARGVSLRR